MEKTYYCYVPIEAKNLLLEYVKTFKEMTGRSVILNGAFYKKTNSGLFTAQSEPIFESQNLQGFVLNADSTDLNDTHKALITSVGGKIFGNEYDYLQYIKQLENG